MNELLLNLDKAITNYPSNLSVFYCENQDLFEVLDDALKRGYPVREEMENLQELYDTLDNHIKFKSEYNEDITCYL